MERHLIDRAAWHWEDLASQSGGHRMQDHILQRIVRNSDVEVPGRLGETGSAVV